jgi:hypothetical protein
MKNKLAPSMHNDEEENLKKKRKLKITQIILISLYNKRVLAETLEVAD